MSTLLLRIPLVGDPEKRPFTFQATLRFDGDIVFVYESVPTILGRKLSDEEFTLLT